MAEDEGSEDLGGILIIGYKKRLLWSPLAMTISSPRLLELQEAKDILAETFDIAKRSVPSIIINRAFGTKLEIYNNSFNV